MGLKYGFAGVAAERNMFIFYGHRLAQVTFSSEGKEAEFFLHFPNGIKASVFENRARQLKIKKIFRPLPGWVPNKEQILALRGELSTDRILCEDYVAQDFPQESLLPPAQDVTDEARFKNPKDHWESAVAFSLSLMGRAHKFPQKVVYA